MSKLSFLILVVGAVGLASSYAGNRAGFLIYDPNSPMPRGTRSVGYQGNTRQNIYDPDSPMPRFSRSVGACNFGQFVDIGSGLICGAGSSIQAHAKIGTNVTIGDNVNIDKFASVGDESILASGANIGQHSAVLEDNEIYENSVVDEHAHIGKGSELERNVYIGKFAQLGSRTQIGESSFVYEFAQLADDTVIPPNYAVVWASSQRLFGLAARAPATCPDVVSWNDENFDARILRKISQTLEDSTVDNGFALESFACLTAEYLFNFYGQEEYNFIMANINQGGVLNGLNNTFHFGKSENKQMLSEEAQKGFLKLLAINSELNRKIFLNLEAPNAMISKIKSNAVTVIASH